MPCHSVKLRDRWVYLLPKIWLKMMKYNNAI